MRGFGITNLLFDQHLSARASSAAAPFAPDGQRLPQRPQWAVLARVSVSQPLAALMSQSAKPASHATAQRPAAQVAVWLAATPHATPHAPQFARSVVRSAQVSFGQRVCAPGQPVPHVEAPPAVVQTGVAPAQALPHAPQCDEPVSGASQPLAGFMSQSAKPAVQAREHIPMAHVAVWLAPPTHGAPHAPQ